MLSSKKAIAIEAELKKLLPEAKIETRSRKKDMDAFDVFVIAKSIDRSPAFLRSLATIVKDCSSVNFGRSGPNFRLIIS